jgi:hypothetical protein
MLPFHLIIYIYAATSLTFMLTLRYFKDSQKNPLKKYLEIVQHNGIVREVPSSFTNASSYKRAWQMFYDCGRL